MLKPRISIQSGQKITDYDEGRTTRLSDSIQKNGMKKELDERRLNTSAQ